MNNRFDAYEVLALIVPGSVVLMALVGLYPKLQSAFLTDGMTLGAFGLFMVASIVVGQLVQALGAIIEGPFWRLFGGMPTNWVRSQQNKILSAAQTKRLEEIIKARIGEGFCLSESSGQDWFVTTREIYARVRSAARHERIDAFNRTYGLMRGMFGAFLAAVVIVSIVRPADWSQFAAMLGVAALLSGFRMYRFAVHYARELFTQFLDLSGE